MAVHPPVPLAEGTLPTFEAFEAHVRPFLTSSDGIPLRNTFPLYFEPDADYALLDELAELEAGTTGGPPRFGPTAPAAAAGLVGMTLRNAADLYGYLARLQRLSVGGRDPDGARRLLLDALAACGYEWVPEGGT